MTTLPNDTIIALATASGVGAIAVIRISGPDAIHIVNRCFNSKFGNKDLTKVKSHTMHLGHLMDEKRTVDEVLVSIFKNPNSYTGENVVEINCHGSVYIQQEIVQLFLRNKVRHAAPGEFTLRAFLNGKMDLSQAEAVADLIASNSAASHQVALQQMRGGFSSEIKDLRAQLLNFASLIELELDFSEEDVAFADREQFKNLVAKIIVVLKRLIDSFALGNVLKNGIPVAIIGEPNVGKSTLLNALLNEDKAIVSDIAGTTRDAIEDEIALNGVTYRFIDTAGIRETTDVIERIGIQKTHEKIESSQLVLYIIDGSKVGNDRLDAAENLTQQVLEELTIIREMYPQKRMLIVLNKIDVLTEGQLEILQDNIEDLLPISAKNNLGIHELVLYLTSLVNTGKLSSNETIVTNSRHYEALNNAFESILAVQTGIEDDLPSDLFAIDIRECLRHLGAITGEFDVDKDILGNLFANFCIGK
ncbi:MAG: tRNA uridine-5-carboxymethylaminomethyl(34) synthesis GTPase MnmE [Flavobacteriaceae bacterium]|nr:tRNA uridine-5-carboxymethylaminomethyl(34) synthesis GTPase MnmE [Flavobacteriaceae bacterium]